MEHRAGLLPEDWVARGLTLQAGQRYYVEILHKATIGADHWSVAWLIDPTGTNTVPAGARSVAPYGGSRRP